MAEWLYEQGIGEDRAILVEGDTILEAAIETPCALRAGAIVAARLTRILVPGRRGLAEAKGAPILIEPLGQGVTEGAAVQVEILREPVPEAGRPKDARGRIVTQDPKAGADLLARITASGHRVIMHGAHGPDRFETCGWSELLDEARTGLLPFPGGALRLSLTPAMALFDVDGTLDPEALAVAGAAAAARAIRRFAIGGSIGIDLPTLPRSARAAPAAAVDAWLPQPFERTAMNGFGFLQIVRRRVRPSLPEILAADPAGAGARALLRRAERAPGTGLRTLIAHPRVIDAIGRMERAEDLLARRIGAPVALQADAGRAISAGDVHVPYV